MVVWAVVVSSLTRKSMIARIDRGLNECELANLAGRRNMPPSKKVEGLIKELCGPKAEIPSSNQAALDLLFMLQAEYLGGMDDCDRKRQGRIAG